MPSNGTPPPGRHGDPGYDPRYLARLYAATTAISAALDDETRLLQRIVEELAALVRARYAALGLLGPGGRLTHFVTTGLTPEEEAALRDNPPHGRGILGVLLQEGQALRLDDLTKDPRSVGFPPGHPVMHTFLGVPLIVGEQVLGRLYATEREGGPFTEEDEMLALGFAAAAAVAIQSARQTAQLVQTERLRATGELAVGVAHDFNNLLATILGRTEVLLGQVRDAQHRESLEAIRRAARDGAATVARMREYGRPVDAAEFRPLDLAAIAREAVELTRPRWNDEAQREGNTIDMRLALQPVPPVSGDAAAVREALVNLLFNAVDALARGGTITVGTRLIDPPEPPPDGDGRTVELWVADTGTGIPADVRGRIFDAFFTTKGPRGTGLGLAMVRKVVDGHGATISVESTPGQGTTFRLRFRALSSAADASADAAAAAAVSAAVGGIGPDDVPLATIFLVDDQEDVLEATGMLLRRDGHDVRTFHDPRAAVEALAMERPDVLITDLGMPGLSGWDVARRAREHWPDLPVIVFTGWGRDVSEAQLREHGVLMALAKPAEVSTLRRALVRALTPADGTALHILLVDDATAFASVLAILLGQGGHQVQRVERAADAIAALEADTPVDLVILDLNLPDLPSVRVLETARARARRGKPVPAVCVISGSAPEAMRSDVPGADLYVEKAYVPEQLDRLFALARTAAGSRRPAAGSRE